MIEDKAGQVLLSIREKACVDEGCFVNKRYTSG